MTVEGQDGILVRDVLASVHHSGAERRNAAGVEARVLKIPVALSSDDLAELTAALASYMERQHAAAME